MSAVFYFEPAKMFYVSIFIHFAEKFVRIYLAKTKSCVIHSQDVNESNGLWWNNKCPPIKMWVCVNVYYLFFYSLHRSYRVASSHCLAHTSRYRLPVICQGRAGSVYCCALSPATNHNRVLIRVCCSPASRWHRSPTPSTGSNLHSTKSWGVGR